MVSSILKLGRTVCSIVYVNAFLLYGLYLLFSFYYGILWHIIKIRMTKSDKKILEGAFRLFLNADYEGASTSDLEAEIGLTRGAIYYSYISLRKNF